MYHVHARGNRRQEIFRDDFDRSSFVALLGRVVARHGWRLFSYVLMDNHYHLLLQTPEPDLPVGMHRLNFLHAQWFNTRYELDGHLFQGRFSAKVVESNWHLLELCRYIPLNAVRAGICSHAGGWPWSSYRATVGLEPASRFLALDWLGEFGSTRKAARESFARFVAEGVAIRAAA